VGYKLRRRRRKRINIKAGISRVCREHLLKKVVFVVVLFMSVKAIKSMSSQDPI